MSDYFRSIKNYVNSFFGQKEPWEVSRDTILLILVAYYGKRTIDVVQEKGVKGALLYIAMKTSRYVPVISSIVESQKSDILDQVRDSLIPEFIKAEEVNYELPDKGNSPDEILAKLREWATVEKDIWGQGLATGAVYHGGDELTKYLTDAYSLFALSNPLHPDLFPYVRKMEAETVSMTAKLFGGDEETCGIMTSGGTESILMAMKAYRDKGIKERGLTKTEIIASATAHAAFEKAAAYFGITLISLPFDPVSGQLRPEDVEKAISSNTVAIVASAPNYPHGVVDPVPELAILAKKYNVGLHVDCCLGSFIVPFAQELGYDIPSFDFTVDGVTSISADTHKYGFAPKGSSVILFKNANLRHYMYFVTSVWPGGIYASPSISGSRPGALVAATWTALMIIGRQGYKEYARQIFAAADVIRKAINNDNEFPELKLIGDSKLSVVGFATKDNAEGGSSIAIGRVTSGMSKKGWHLANLQRPAGAHFCVTYANHGNVKQFLVDLKSVMEEISKDSKIYNSSSVQLYGAANALGESTKPGQDDGLIGDIARAYIDALTYVPPRTKAHEVEYVESKESLD